MEKKKEIRHFRDLIVYQLAFENVMEIFQLTKGFPSAEKYSLIDQIRRSSRAVCSNLALPYEIWLKRS